MGTQPTLCEITYDSEWEEIEVLALNSGSRTASGAFWKPGGQMCSNNQAWAGTETTSMYSGHSTFYDMLRTYYWEHANTFHQPGSASPTIIARPNTGLTWYTQPGDDSGFGASSSPGTYGRYGDKGTSLSLPSLSKGSKPSPVFDGEEKSKKARLRWVDALNTWVPDNKQSQTGSFVSFINTAPRIEKQMAAKQALQRRSQKPKTDAALAAKRQRTAYSSHSDTKKERTVRFHTSHSSSFITEEIKMPDTTLTDKGDENVDDDVDGDESEEMELVEATEMVLAELPDTTFDVIEPLALEHERISSTEEPTSIIPKYNAAITKKTELKSQPEPEMVKAEKRKKKALPTPKPKPAPPPVVLKPKPKPPPPPPPSKQAPPPPPKKPVPPPVAKQPVRIPQQPKPKPKPTPPPPPPPPPKVKAKPAPPPPVKAKDVKPKPVPKPEMVVKPKPKVVVKRKQPMEEEEEVQYAQMLPISGPEDMLTDEDLLKETEEPQDEVAKRSRSPIKKKEKVDRRPVTPVVEEEDPPSLPTPPPFNHHKRGSIDWGSSDGEEEEEGEDQEPSTDRSDASYISVNITNPDLPTLDLSKPDSRRKHARHALQFDPATGQMKRGRRKHDREWEEEQRRLRLAEERRRKQQAMYNKIKSKAQNFRVTQQDDREDSHACFDDYDFLAKYCIFPQGSIDMYKHAFDTIDEDGRGWLPRDDVAMALRVVNNKLTGMEEEFMYRILEIIGYKITDGADFKLFSVIAALSQRISALDSWMKLMISEVNFKLLEMKTFLCKNLWQVCVDEDSKRIHLDQLIVELRSGGISHKHEEEVKDKLGHLLSMDLLEFLTYSPLFIMIHMNVVDNPLSDSRDK